MRRLCRGVRLPDPRPSAVMLVVVSTAALGGCGGTPSAPEPERTRASGEVTVGPDGVQSITLVSGDDYRFVPAEFTVVPGLVSLTVDNAATRLTHSLDFPPGTSPGDIAESIPVLAPTERDTIEFSVRTPGSTPSSVRSTKPKGIPA